MRELGSKQVFGMGLYSITLPTFSLKLSAFLLGLA